MGLDRRTFLRLSGLVALTPAVELLSQARADHTIRIRRSTVELAPGKSVIGPTYNGQFPGPLLRLTQGRSVVVDVHNETSQSESLRWHSQDVPLRPDDDVLNGAHRLEPHELRRIAFTPTEPGLRLYHSNQAGSAVLGAGPYGAQAGAVMIEPRQQAGRFDREVVLILKEFEPRLHRGAHGFEVRYGCFSINGRVLGHGEPIRVRARERVLFHVVNASATEIRRLALPGHAFQILQLDDRAVPTTAAVPVIRLGVGERVSALVSMDQPGVWILGDVRDEDRQKGMGIVVEYAGCRGPARWVPPGADSWSYSRFGARRPAIPHDTIEMTFDTAEAARSGFSRWTINGGSFAAAAADPAFTLRVGWRYRLKLHNRGAVAHCLHLPRHQFELAHPGVNAVSGVVKDVVTIEAGERLEMDLVPEKPGSALLHCGRRLYQDFGLSARVEVA